MQTIGDLLPFVRSGQQPVVTFAKGIEDKEEYAEPGMRARIVGIRDDNDDVVEITFRYEEFDEFNKPFESANYYDRGGKAVLTAREAGKYKPQDTIYFDKKEKLSDQFRVEGDAALVLFEEYKAAPGDLTYVGWLEQQLLSFRAKG